MIKPNKTASLVCRVTYLMQFEKNCCPKFCNFKVWRASLLMAEAAAADRCRGHAVGGKYIMIENGWDTSNTLEVKK